jgi:hypothetical protein
VRQHFRSATRPTRFQLDGLAFDISDIAQPLSQGIEDWGPELGTSRMKEADDRHPLSRLRLRLPRPCDPTSGQQRT